MPSLNIFLNKTLLASITALFLDGKSRPYRLMGIELQGLWLQDDTLAERLNPKDLHAADSVLLTIFVPYSQILCAVVPALPHVPPVADVAHATDHQDNVRTKLAAEEQGKVKKKGRK